MIKKILIDDDQITTLAELAKDLAKSHGWKEYEVDNGKGEIKFVSSEGVKCVVAAEVVPGKSVFAWDYEYRFPMALVLGNEALGIAPETLELCDGIVELPMFGRKESINVGNAAAAILYAVVAKTRMKETK